MKGGIVYANFVTTVSPRYAWEIQNTEQGMGLQGVLRTHDRKFGGVLNGIDYDGLESGARPHIAQPTGRTACRGRRQQGGPAPRPRAAGGLQAHRGVVSRLDRQKGVHLIRHAVHYYALEQGCQMVLLGSAQEPAIDAVSATSSTELEATPTATWSSPTTRSSPTRSTPARTSS
jgi:starch synthase